MTLYLDQLPDEGDLYNVESAVGREMAEVACINPAVNLYSDDLAIVEDARYWLRGHRGGGRQ